MTFLGDIRRTAFSPAGEMVAALCLSMLRFAGKATQAVDAIGRAIERRRVMAELAALDDHMLRDIGVTRSDLRDASASPVLGDPTRLLVLRATERRAAWRLAARDRMRG